jgi:hypothetical protein
MASLYLAAPWVIGMYVMSDSLINLRRGENLKSWLNTWLSRGRFQTDGQTDGRTMAARASVTWTHCSVLFEVTWEKTRRVHADMSMRPHGRTRVCEDAPMSARKQPSVRADASPSPPFSLPPLPSPPLPSPPLPSPFSLLPLYCPRGREKNLKKLKN